ncbi:MAG: DUF6418 domain-containing protein [Bdellovibrionales bacterium]
MTRHGVVFTMTGIISVLAVLLLASMIVESVIIAPLALVVFAAFCAIILRAYPVVFILLLWFIFIRLTAVLSSVAIESGGFMPEILTQGDATGATLRMVAVYIAGLIALTVILHGGTRRIDRITAQTPQCRLTKLWVPLLYLTLTALISGALIIGVKHGFPALSGADRIAYWRQIDNRFFYFFLGNRFIFAVLLGLCASVSHGANRMLSLILMLAMLVVSFLFAEKFSSIALILFGFLTPVLILTPAFKKHLDKSVMGLSLLVAVLTVPATLNAYGVFQNPDNAVMRLQTRAVSQAQIWYVQDSLDNSIIKFDTDRIDNNIRAMTARHPDQYADTLGARDFMIGYMPPDRYEHYLQRGVTLTLATEGYLLKLFGRIGMIPVYSALLGVYAGYLLYLYYGVKTRHPLRVILAAKLLVWANFGLNQGYVWFLIGVKPALLVALILVFEMAQTVISKKRAAQKRVAHA